MSDRDQDGRRAPGRGLSPDETAAQLDRLRAGLRKGLRQRNEARRQAAAAASEIAASRPTGQDARRPATTDADADHDAHRFRREDLGAQPYDEDFDETDPDAVADLTWDDSDDGPSPRQRPRRARAEARGDAWESAAEDDIWSAAAAVRPQSTGRGEPPRIDDDVFDEPFEPADQQGAWDDGDWSDVDWDQPFADRPAPTERRGPNARRADGVENRDAPSPRRRRAGPPVAAPSGRFVDRIAARGGVDDDDQSVSDDALFDEAVFGSDLDPDPQEAGAALPRRGAAGRMARGRRADPPAAQARDDDARPTRSRRSRRPTDDEDRAPPPPARRSRPSTADWPADAPTRPSRPAATPSRGAGAFSSVERMLSGRYLRARRKEGFISVIALLSLIGIALGVATLIIVMSVMNGFRAELVGRIVGVNGHLTVTSFSRAFDDYLDVADAIRSVPGVVRAAPIIEGQVFVSGPRGGTGALVRGVSHDDLMTLERVAITPEAAFGSLVEFGSTDGVAIGDAMARRLDVSVGDRISLISPNGAATPFGVAPRRRSYEVLYVFKTGMFQFDSGMVFMPLEEAQTFFNRAGVVDGIEVMVATPDDLDGYAEDIDAAAGRAFAYSTWQERNGAFIGALNTERSVMFIILSLLILIASLIIISGLIMLVKEKGPDIAILRTMGATRGAILRVFFLCGATIGVVGATIGVALGVVIALNISAIKEFVDGVLGYDTFSEEIYLLSTLPSQLHWEDVGMTVAITLGLSFLATLYPAWRAARLDPVEALRNG